MSSDQWSLDPLGYGHVSSLGHVSASQRVQCSLALDRSPSPLFLTLLLLINSQIIVTLFLTFLLPFTFSYPHYYLFSFFLFSSFYYKFAIPSHSMHSFPNSYIKRLSISLSYIYIYIYFFFFIFGRFFF